MKAVTCNCLELLQRNYCDYSAAEDVQVEHSCNTEIVIICSFPAAMSKALDLHDKTARSLLKQFHGHEVKSVPVRSSVWANTTKDVNSTPRPRQ